MIRRAIMLPTVECLPGDIIRLTEREYITIFHRDKLAGWVRFYHRMAKRYGHKSETYRRTEAALKEVL